jgi:hypothetical protein
MQRLILVGKLLGLSALLLGSIFGSFIIIGLYVFLGLGWLAIGAYPTSFSEILFLLLGLILILALIYLYWRFIVLGVFKHVRKSLIQKA